jgi:hypothetical protein
LQRKLTINLGYLQNASTLKTQLVEKHKLNFRQEKCRYNTRIISPRRLEMKYKLTNTVCAALFIMCPVANALTPVDVELQLLIDISGSISSNEYNLQMLGYSNAFASDNVQNAIINGTQGQIAVQLIMWSGSNDQEVSIDWTLIDSADSADNLSASIADIARPFSGWTAIGSAIDYSYSLFESNDFLGTHQIIDISGDGTNNSGSNPAEASANALSNGVDTINGIVITDDQTVIDQYYNDVIGGDSPFLLSPANFQDFQTAIENKIVAEIAGTTPPQAIVVNVPEPSTLALFAISIVIIFRRSLFK